MRRRRGSKSCAVKRQQQDEKGEDVLEKAANNIEYYAWKNV